MKKSKMQLEAIANRAFVQGFAAAAATIARSGYGRMAFDALQSNGLTLEHLTAADVEEFDYAPLAEIPELKK